MATQQNALDDKGVTVNGQHWSWDEFNSVPPEQQAQILKTLGLGTDQTKQVLGALQKMQIGEKSVYDFKKQFGNVYIPKDQYGYIEKNYPNLPLTAPISTGSRYLENPEQLYQTSGLQDILKNIGTQQKEVAAGATPPGSAAAETAATGGTGAFPAISQQALDYYVKTYLMPAQQQLHNLIQGDMSQWQQAIQGIAGATGQQNSPVTQLYQQFAKLQSPLYQMLASATANAQLTQPYTTLMNQAVGQQAKTGARALDLGSTLNTLLQYGLLDQSGFSTATGAGGANVLGNAGTQTAGIQSLLQGLTSNKPVGTG